MAIDRTALLEDLRLLNPERFDPPDARAEQVVEALLNRVNTEGHLPGSATEEVLRDLCGTDRSKRSCRNAILGIFQSLNATGRVTIALPPQPVVRPRPSRASPNATRFAALTTVEALEQFLADSGRLQGRPAPENALLGAAMRLVTQAGAGEAVTVGILARLRRKDMEDDGTLWTPIHSGYLGKAAYRFRPPEGVRALLRHLYWRVGQSYPEHRLFHELVQPERPGAPESPQEAQNLVNGLRDWLQAQFDALAVEFYNSPAGNNREHRINRWRAFAYAGQELAFLQAGLPPALIGVLAEYPLPAETPIPLEAGAGETLAGDRHILNRGSGHLTSANTKSSGANRDPGLSVSAMDVVPEDWPRQAANLLQSFRTSAKRHASSRGHVRAPQRQKAFLEDFAHLRASADALAPTTSLLHLALDWGHEKLCGDGVTVSTLATYFQRLFPMALLSREETFDLSEWDAETVETLTDHVLEIRGWNPATRQHYLSTWAQLLRYAQQSGLLEEVQIRIEGPEAVVAPGRTQIVTPQEADTALEILGHSPDWEDQAQATALALGFYGGLRASEVLALTLADLYWSNAGTWIYIWSGKTRRSRRRVPLHRVTPPFVQELVREWGHRRWRSIAEDLPPTKIALFGPEANPAGYPRQDLIDPLLARLRPILGSEFDFHLLRHSCASWLMLRREVAQDPAFRHELKHGQHWIFSEEALDQLRNLLNEPGGPIDPGDDWLRIAKFIGHRDLATLLRTYVHTLGLIHSRALNPG